jgi:hypothetical protein
MRDLNGHPRTDASGAGMSLVEQRQIDLAKPDKVGAIIAAALT